MIANAVQLGDALGDDGMAISSRWRTGTGPQDGSDTC
jgi:hypothetical protein